MVKAYLSLLGSFLLWGMFPLYFYLTRHVSALETMEWRIVLSVVCLVGVCLWRGTLKIVSERLCYPRFIAIGLITGILITLNWLCYIIAIYHNQTTQASMGYFITPLINVFFGMWLFSEKLSRWQWLALALTTTSVIYQIFVLGTLPWLSLAIGFTFGLYSALRKFFRVPPFAGLLLEVSLLMPFALAALIWGQITGDHFDYSSDYLATGALLFSGVMTVLPLLMFLYGVEHLSMATVGFTQYISPTIQFLLAIFIFHESLDSHRLIAFILVWAGVIIYLIDTTLKALKQKENKVEKK